MVAATEVQVKVTYLGNRKPHWAWQVLVQGWFAQAVVQACCPEMEQTRVLRQKFKEFDYFMWAKNFSKKLPILDNLYTGGVVVLDSLLHVNIDTNDVLAGDDGEESGGNKYKDDHVVHDDIEVDVVVVVKVFVLMTFSL